MAIGKSIRIYLAEATVTGIRYAELVNWTGHAIACPRNRLNELTKWPEAAKPGVYFLFESCFGVSKPIAYVGESENVAQRLTSHDRNKEFWNEVIIFTSKNENFTKAYIKYLEYALVVLSKLSDRYLLENGNTLPESSLPHEGLDSMEEFVVTVLGVLGYPILEPILRTKNSCDLNKELNKESESINALREFTFTVNNLTAKGVATDEGFVIKNGSLLSKTNTDSIPGKLASSKDRLLEDGAIKEDGNRLIATEDILFSSSSYVVAFVAGTSRSGPQSWKAANGKTMKQIEDDSLAHELRDY